jgi:hypothetical protein
VCVHRTALVYIGKLLNYDLFLISLVKMLLLSLTIKYIVIFKLGKFTTTYKISSRIMQVMYNLRIGGSKY